MSTPINFPTLIPKFDAILARGLCSDIGKQGSQVCVAAAICEAMGLPHGDEPTCVARAVREYTIALNVKNWSSPAARAAGLRELGIAQIGSRGVVSNIQFAKRLAEKTIRVLLPAIFREGFPDQQWALNAADRCEKEGTVASAQAAREAASVYDAAYAAAAANAAANASAAYAAANAAAAYAAAAANASAANAAANASAAYAAAVNAAAAYANAAAAAAYANAAANAAAAYAAAAYAANAAAVNAVNAAANASDVFADAADATYAAVTTAHAAGTVANAADKYLLLSASLALETLRELESPGCAWV